MEYQNCGRCEKPVVMVEGSGWMHATQEDYKNCAGIVAPTAPVGQPGFEHSVDELAQRVINENPPTTLSAAYRQVAKDLYHTINPIGRPAAPAANALPELIPTDEDNAATIEWEGAAEGWPKDAVPVGWLTCRERQLAAAQQEIAARLIHEKSQFDEIKVLRKISDEATFELTALRQKYAELLEEIVEARELAKLKEIPSRVTLSRWESAITHAELLGGKK